MLLPAPATGSDSRFPHRAPSTRARAAEPSAGGERRKRGWGGWGASGAPRGTLVLTSLALHSPCGLAKRNGPLSLLRSFPPTGDQAQEIGEPEPSLRTCPHLALSFARPYLGLSFGTSTEMLIFERRDSDFKAKTRRMRTAAPAS